MNMLHETMSWSRHLSTTDVLLLVIIVLLMLIRMHLSALHATMRYWLIKPQWKNRVYPQATMRRLAPINVGDDADLHRQFAQEVAANSAPYDFGRQQAKTYEATKHLSNPEI